MKFSEFELNDWILKSLAAMNYDEPTDIQAQVIKTALAWKNIIWQSQTWTGKTAAFLIPLLQKIDNTKRWVQALILAPTRELVNQIGEEIALLTKHHKVNTACIYGGAKPAGQKNKLITGPNIIVATPWRLIDFIDQKVVNLWKVDYLILDEVDRMLDMGFVRDIQKIRALMPSIKQTLTFSATISNDIKKIINEHVPNYEFIKIWEEITVDKINHSYLDIQHTDKLFNLIKMVQEYSKDKIVVFTQTKRNTKAIYLAINKYVPDVYMLNWDMNQNKRNSTLREFKSGNLRILVTTDVAARWLNMDNVNLVINFDVPKESESYIHRIGRTWRAWASGKAIMFVSPEEKDFLAAIEITHKTKVKKSEYVVVADAKSEFSEIRLDKSTDKFGKWRPNPNRSPRPREWAFAGRPESKNIVYGEKKRPFNKNKSRHHSRGR